MQDSDDPKETPKKKDWRETGLSILFVWAITAFACYYTASTYNVIREKKDPNLTRIVEIGSYKCIDLPKRIKCFPSEE